MVKKIKHFEKVSLESIRKGLFESNLKRSKTDDYNKMNLQNVPYAINEDIILPDEVIEQYKQDYPSINVSEFEKYRDTTKVSKFSVMEQ